MQQRQVFQPVDTFSWEINRSERTRQARWLVPLLDTPEGRAWLLERLQCPCSPEEAAGAEAFHFCFPLRDVFTADYNTCRGDRPLEDQFIPYYNRLFGLPQNFGIQEIWRTGPDGVIRHPAAGGRAGWHEDFLRGNIPDEELYALARNMRRMLGTEADALLLTDQRVVWVECKYRSVLSIEQYERQGLTGRRLAERLDKRFHFGRVLEAEPDPRFAKITGPYVLWSEVEAKLKDVRARATDHAG